MPRTTRASRKRTAPRADATEVSPTRAQEAGTLTLNVAALTASISTAVSQAVQAALTPTSGQIARQEGPQQQLNQVVSDEVSDIRATRTSGSQDVPLLNEGESNPKRVFTSIAVSLGSRVSSKLKAKIWAEEYVDFGALLSISPQQEKYSLSMGRLTGSSRDPQLTLEPCHQPKKITTIDQWLTAFHTYVSIYCEKSTENTSRLMKYCETVRDIAQKPGDWQYYDEQFRYLRQSAPDLYPWDQVHWELWLGAVTNFRKPQQQGFDYKASQRGRFRPNQFPKGTCWPFQGGRFCKGCQFEHVCYKCGGKHPACNCTTPEKRGEPKPGPYTRIANPVQHAGHPSKGGKA